MGRYLPIYGKVSHVRKYNYLYLLVNNMSAVGIIVA